MYLSLFEIGRGATPRPFSIRIKLNNKDKKMQKSNITIFRTPRPFVTIDKNIIDDKDLDFEDIGLFAVISHLCEKENPEREIRHCIGNDLRRYWKLFKLINKGYIEVDDEMYEKIISWEKDGLYE